MHPRLKQAFESEMKSAHGLFAQKEYDQAFRHLERAHILGQPYPMAHTVTHYYMLKIGWVKKDVREIIGQLVRIPAGFLGSVVGLVPTGNTGGANISALKRLPIPTDLQQIIDDK